MWLSFYQSLTVPLLIIVLVLFVLAVYWCSKMAKDEKTIEIFKNRALMSISVGIFIGALAALTAVITEHIDNGREYNQHAKDHAEAEKQRAELNKKMNMLLDQKECYVHRAEERADAGR